MSLLSLRNEAGGLALSSCQKQHQEVWMGEKGKDNEATLNMNKDALTPHNPYPAQVHLFAKVQFVILECALRTMLKHSALS